MMLTICMSSSCTEKCERQSWFQKLLAKTSLAKQPHPDANLTQNSRTSVRSASASPEVTSSLCSSPSSSSSSSSSVKAHSKQLRPQSLLNSSLRWSQKYDVFVCHSSAHSDAEEAERLVSFLEASPGCLRCFLWQRNSCPGGAIPTEVCQAVQESHYRVLLITPNFLQDDWCKYMMHQCLAEGPVSGQTIPLLQNLSFSQYPQEMKFFFYVDLTKNPNRGYALVKNTVLNYLEDMGKKEKLDCNKDISSEISDRGTLQEKKDGSKT